MYAACDASVVSVLSNNQVVLKADCGDGVTGIQWFRDNNSLTGGADVPLGYTTAGGAGATGRDIYFTTTLYPGIHVYKATANSGAITAGNLATVSASMPPPTIGNAPDQTVTIGSSYSFSLAPYVANSHGNLTYSITGALPSGLSLNTASGAISGTPGAGAVGGTITWTATDDNGSGTPSDQVVYTVSSGTPPTAPTSVVATAGNAQISVAFSGQSLGTGTLTNYTATCGGQSNAGSSSPIIVGGLTNGTPYTCTVTITTSVAPPVTSAPSNSVTPSAGTPPTAPTSVVATAGNAQISVAFSGQNLGTGTLTNYAASCNGGTAVPGQSSPITVTGLTNGTPYTCTVTVTTSVGSSIPSNPSNSVTPSAGMPPTAPTSVVATAGNAQISVAFSGQNLGTGTLTNYAANCTSSGSGTAGSATGSASPITVTSLTNGQPYTCTVTVTTSVAPPDTSGPSNSVTPSASTCSGGVEWTNFNRPGLTTSGTLLGGANQTTVSYSFVMGKTDFPGGAQILLNVSGSYSNVRDHFISSCPGDFTNPPAGATLANCRRLNAKTGTMYLGYTDDPATQNSLTCNLVPGQTYYLNMRTVYSSSQGAYLSSGYLLNTNWR
ncbi:MAG: putative Ig domain-containing protein [Rhodocyclaceae bacterium]|nr:putative Ig domain-containing protein [Rhodocyclaceae bacterium]MBK6554388.1 putative Ig domain-containing protein [Rhodocyclaceae bacterium]MBK9310331.1 putative Ig domain-containing protein [Rhodocyclaceae bacterium]